VFPEDGVNDASAYSSDIRLFLRAKFAFVCVMNEYSVCTLFEGCRFQCFSGLMWV